MNQRVTCSKCGWPAACPQYGLILLTRDAESFELLRVASWLVLNDAVLAAPPHCQVHMSSPAQTWASCCHTPGRGGVLVTPGGVTKLPAPTLPGPGGGPGHQGCFTGLASCLQPMDMTHFPPSSGTGRSCPTFVCPCMYMYVLSLSCINCT